jgi:hypothetical protein
MIPINTNPSPRELRWFGLIFAAFFGVVGLIVWRQTGSPAAPRVIWIAAGVIAAVYYAVPPMRRALYLGWLYATYPLGWVVSHVLLGIIYFGVMMPIGLAMRLLGRDPMTRRFDRQASTYWVKREQNDDPGRYFKQF